MKFPSLSEQGFSFADIPQEKLWGKGERFNPSIIRYKGELLLSYRAYGPDGKMKMAVSGLDETLNPTWSKFIKTPSVGQSEIHEDGRLFEHEGNLWLTSVEIDRTPTDVALTIHFTKLRDDFSVWADYVIPYGNNGVCEKNWMPLSHNGKLYIYYDLQKQEVFELDEATGTVARVSKGGKTSFDAGHLRGGTPFLPYQDGYMCIAHGCTHEPMSGRRYYAIGVRVEGGWPFKVTHFSRPIFFGSEDEPYCGDGSNKCVFPCGYITEGGVHRVATGINDTRCYVIDVPDERLSWIKAEDWPEHGFRCYAILSKNIPTDITSPFTSWFTVQRKMNQAVSYCRTFDEYTQKIVSDMPFTWEVAREEWESRTKVISKKRVLPVDIPEKVSQEFSQTVM